jgi:peptidoglycan/xylan/chitin deacetylase (PgdA/CDA1 family)
MWAGPAAAVAGGVATVWGAPLVASVQPLRRVLTPHLLPARLSGVSSSHHVALTFDDGPDTQSTPAFLDLLAERGTLATFFLLGRHAIEATSLVRQISDEGHEVAVHGWTHRSVVAIEPRHLARQLKATKQALEQLTGQRVRWYRPPYGILTAPALVAARSAGLSTVLWSDWGVDWRRGRTPEQVLATVTGGLRPGGTVLLHDTDRTSAPGSWRTTLTATERLLDVLDEHALPVGPLAEHWTR